MEREEYFNFMKETSKHTKPHIKASFEEIQAKNPDIYEFFQQIPLIQKRQNKAHQLRPMVLRLAYELAGGSNWQETVQASAAFEILNLSTYIDNTILDQKGNPRTKEEENKYLCCARILRNQGSQLLRTTYHNQTLNQLFDNTDKTIYVGQFQDTQNFTYEQIENLTEKKFLPKYIQRCNQITGIFFENIAKSGAILANATSQIASQLGTIGNYFGIMGQIINDIGDFIPPDRRKGCNIEKVYQDQYSDIKNNKVTLPLFYALQNANQEDRNTIVNITTGTEPTPITLDEVTKILIRTNAIAQAKKRATEFSKRAEEQLNQFPKCKARNYLKMMLQMPSTSKYNIALRLIEKQMQSGCYFEE